jgi:hypothetical protein
MSDHGGTVSVIGSYRVDKEQYCTRYYINWSYWTQIPFHRRFIDIRERRVELEELGYVTVSEGRFKIADCYFSFNNYAYA